MKKAYRKASWKALPVKNFLRNASLYKELFPRTTKNLEEKFNGYKVKQSEDTLRVQEIKQPEEHLLEICVWWEKEHLQWQTRKKSFPGKENLWGTPWKAFPTTNLLRNSLHHEDLFQKKTWDFKREILRLPRKKQYEEWFW